MALTSTGLTTPTLAEVLDDLRTRVRNSATLNPTGRVNLDDDSVLGQLIAIVGDQLVAVYQGVQAVYASQYRASAEGASLDSLAELIGVVRIPAAASTVTLSFTGTDGTVIPSGSRFGDPNRTDISWISIGDVTIASGVASVEAQASVTGPTSANTGTITSIVTPIAGLTTVNNAADASPGRELQSDASLRQTMIDLLFAAGAGTAPAIRSALLAVPGVLEAFVFENTTTTTNSFGVPEGNIEAVVDGGDDVDIAAAIYANKAAGTGTYSNAGDGEWVEDVNGEDQFMAFSRPVDVPIFVYVEVETNGSNTNVVAEVKTAVAAYGNQSTVGAKVRRSRYNAPVFSVSGVLNALKIGVSKVDAAGALAAANLDGAAADIAMAFREKARFDTARITVVEV